jgi:hypothetical protein
VGGKAVEGNALLVEDALTKVKVSKTDIVSGAEFEGAHIQVIETVVDDKTGEKTEKVVREWTSTTEPHEIEGLKTGVTYTLRETVAPEGYAIASDSDYDGARQALTVVK